MLLAHIGLMAGFLLVFITDGIAKQPLSYDGQSQKQLDPATIDERGGNRPCTRHASQHQTTFRFSSLHV